MAKKSLDNASLFYEKNVNLDDRIIFITGDIESSLCAEVKKSILLLKSINSIKPITIIIDSQGGDAYSSFGLYDFIMNEDIEINTHVSGCAMSGGATIYMAGTKRTMSPYSTLMFHTVSGDTNGKNSDIKIDSKEFDDIHDKMCEIYAVHSNKSIRYWRKLIEHSDIYIRYPKAIVLGLVDGDEI